MIRIKKLTPPQIAALRETFPASVQAGWLSTTASVATFHQLPGKNPWQPENLSKLLNAMVPVAKEPIATLLANVERKVRTRPDLVEVVL